jgi:hypothetical protein
MDENLAVADMPESFRADRAVGWNRAPRRTPARGKGRGKVLAAKKPTGKSSVARKKSSSKPAPAKKPVTSRKKP